MTREQSLGTATYRNPVIAWLNEMRVDALPEREPPGVPFIVTRSEIVIRPQGAVVHIWYAPPPPAVCSPFPARLMAGEEVITRADLRGP